MVRELERERQKSDFPETAPAANLAFFIAYIAVLSCIEAIVGAIHESLLLSICVLLD
jgi:hypothetical protein